MPSFNQHKNKNVSVITKISDELWDIISITLQKEKPNNTIGRPAIPFRKVLDGIVYVLRPAVNGSCSPKYMVQARHVIDDFKSGLIQASSKEYRTGC